MAQVKFYTSHSPPSPTPEPPIGVERLAEDPLLIPRLHHDVARLSGVIQVSTGASDGWNDATDASATPLEATGELWKQSDFALNNWGTGFSAVHWTIKTMPCGFRASFSSWLSSRVTTLVRKKRLLVLFRLGTSWCMTHERGQRSIKGMREYKSIK